MSAQSWKHADIAHVMAATMAAIGCLCAFFMVQPVDPHRHHMLVSSLTQLQRDEASLGEEVMRLNFNLANDYDRLTAIATRLRDAEREIRNGDNAKDVRRESEFQYQFNLLEQRLQIKLSALERFKSTNSIAKNSLIYLPQLRDTLEKQIVPGSKVHERIDELIELILLQNSNAATLDRGNPDHIVALLEDDLNHMPDDRQSDELKTRFKALLQHARLAIRLSNELHILQEQLASPENGDGLSAAYSHYYDRQVTRVSTQRTNLLLAMLVLFGYGTFFFYRWREQSLLEKGRSTRLAAAVFESQEGMVVTDADNVIQRVNHAFSRITGYTPDEAVGQKPSLLKSGRHDDAFYAAMWESINCAGVWEGEIWNRRKNGDIYPEHLTITVVKDTDGHVANYVATLKDITVRKAAEDEIRSLAFHDPLTRLPNRRLFLDRLEHALGARARHDKSVALLYIDLDRFKTLNDTLGHDCGDLMLQQVAARLMASLRQSDTAARIGGDEFVVLLEDLSPRACEAMVETRLVAEKILIALSRPYWLKQHEFHCSASIGATVIGEQEASTEQLLKQADLAMYRSKTAGRNTLRFFEPEMLGAVGELIEGA